MKVEYKFCLYSTIFYCKYFRTHNSIGKLSLDFQNMNEYTIKVFLQTLPKQICQHSVQKIQENKLYDPITEPQEFQFPFAGRNGARVLFEDIQSCAKNIMQNELVPVNAFQIKIKHFFVILLHTILQALSVSILPFPLGIELNQKLDYF